MATAKKTTTKKTTTTKATAVKEPEVKEETKIEEPASLEASTTEVAPEVLSEEKVECPAVDEVKKETKKTTTKKTEEKKAEAPAVLKFTGGVLTGDQIIKEVESGDIIIEGFDKNKVGANSYDLLLGDVLKTYIPIFKNPINPKDTTLYMDMLKENPYNEFKITDKGFPLLPGILYIGTTKERVFTEKFMPTLDGRSSIGRLGVAVHITAGFGDIGFDGRWTLEITTVHPIIIYPNIPVCQVSFHTPYGDTRIKYNGRYQNQTGAETSKLYLN